ncbi:methylmalonyl-CoA mutase subunit beta [Robiginitalea marina]|uniref:Methylmalonyl-CoA mutase subunit beta n=1 Tax=Robiginitalea marina TaxID=2954105 RepID=A0ABT1B0K9_9FLAO|nr:methylmalonyl-CoA mutase subunit beta [Robiginitalea marina]MCO5725437.1 methylmalonyl-CoA mutase subunit beta [Robiginitalea marina]
MKKNEPFGGFEPVSPRQWKQLIQADLKGEDYNDLLTWQSPEGITVKPFYTAEDLPAGLNGPSGLHPGGWEIGYSLDLDQEGAAGRAQQALEGGAERLLVRPGGAGPGALQNLYGLQAPLYFDLDQMGAQWLDGAKALKGSNVQWLSDPIGSLAARGNWTVGEEADLAFPSRLWEAAGTGVHMAIHADLYQNAGADRVQELAYSLSQGHEYLLQAETDARLKPLLETPVFVVAVGNEYFFEIAKLRALRALWKLLATAYGYSGDCLVIARPTLRNKTLYDYNTNMLRTASECMAAVIGGADLICNLPYDTVYHWPNSFGDRISRNQLLLLRHESYFSGVSNAADGAYYIESLTDQLGSKAMGLFRTLEKGGGLLNQLKAHKIQKKIRESARAEQQAFDEGRLVLVGSNKYPNPDDRMKGELEVSHVRRARREKTLMEPILPARLSFTYEQKRLSNE